MKRILLPLIVLFAFSLSAQAGDCMRDPVYDRDWNAVITTGARVRDIPCMEGSEILTTVPVGEVIHVIAETDGWYKIERKDGIIGWSGQWLMEPTDQPFVKDVPKEPLYDVMGHVYETAVRYLANKKIVQGYPDDSFKPDETVNRAEFTKILVGAKLGEDPTSFASDCFPDVPKTEWYASYVCYAKQQGIISGYPDGYFRPANNINLAESAKILVNTFGLEAVGCGCGAPWYEPYIQALQNQSYIPSTLTAFTQNVMRGEMAEMIWRIMEEIHTSPFSQFSF